MITYLYHRFTALHNERGATAAEYGVLIALIAVGIMVAATGLATGISNIFDDVALKLTNAL